MSPWWLSLGVLIPLVGVLGYWALFELAVASQHRKVRRDAIAAERAAHIWHLERELGMDPTPMPGALPPPDPRVTKRVPR